MEKQANEKNEIIRNGNFHFGGRIFEFDQGKRQFHLIPISEVEYTERVNETT